MDLGARKWPGQPEPREGFHDFTDSCQVSFHSDTSTMQYWDLTLVGFWLPDLYKAGIIIISRLQRYGELAVIIYNSYLEKQKIHNPNLCANIGGLQALVLWDDVAHERGNRFVSISRPPLRIT